MERGTIHDVSFFSKALQESIQLYIYTPANYTPLTEYQLLIASDGNDYFQLGGITKIADELIDDMEIDELIIVFVPYDNVQDRRDKYVPSGKKHREYLQFLAHELVPYIDREYATTPVAHARGLIGDSMAATVSLLGALTYPNIFGKAILQSPYVDEDVLDAVENFANPSSISVYHIVGKKEDEVLTTEKKVADFLTPNRELHEVMQMRGYHLFYDEFNGNHTWKYWKPDLRRALIKNFN
ncbi:hypothetical protein GCM10007425_13170 [Lysinibacillus alkalisoli]|uniref:Esterase family protein n=1 Tax=Lysinibacillus alkalisoli TaxID=1911548 RepID=A0A917G3I4_9BACI|nr:alpha/beta hydrolase-fold protein [Lysinibacillus alkalisoli]GGG20122.1 hypothetical protein GCM10007425_13170 [Lysinibacillus alkalisoli]